MEPSLNGTGKEVALEALLAWVTAQPAEAALHIYLLQQSEKSYDDMLLGFRELFVSVLRVIDEAREKENATPS